MVDLQQRYWAYKKIKPYCLISWVIDPEFLEVLVCVKNLVVPSED